MGASFFKCKQFTIHQQHCSMKVTTDACLFGAWVAQRIKEDSAIQNILDIGAGTGLLSLMLAQKNAATIDAIELQQKDHLQCVENIAASPWKARIHSIHADANAFAYSKKYDVVISNPPFYENDLRSTAAHKNIAHHDAGLTLTALLKIVKKQLSPTGKGYVLLPEKRKPTLLESLANTGLFANHTVYVHQTEKHTTPFRIITEISNTQTQTTQEQIVIKKLGAYTTAFTLLLKDYYIAL